MTRDVYELADAITSASKLVTISMEPASQRHTASKIEARRHALKVIKKAVLEAAQHDLSHQLAGELRRRGYASERFGLPAREPVYVRDGL